MDIVVETVPDAEAAVATLRRTAARYDLLVVEPDGMGGMGGYALCSWLRANGASLAGGACPASVRDHEPCREPPRDHEPCEPFRIEAIDGGGRADCGTA